ncbi:hypothetical protein [Rhizobium sp. BK176]|uniref:hypothetical protein n=1 Tax=Rhizobium sp. BK176 TaxID=2587071 RepID=UPI0021671C8D|nr:hypothetical protein [Rhizobium sp. BK176]MCS4089979.1 hypothetical protein [Rhizobium sp. BK176]
MPLNDDERRLMAEIPPQHLGCAVPFQYAAERAGFDWETGKKMLQSFLDRKLIWDLNEDTLTDTLGICDRTRLGDLEMGVYISISRERNGTHRVHRPSTGHERREGNFDGKEVYLDTRKEAVDLAFEGMRLKGINIVSIRRDGHVDVIGYIESDFENLPRVANQRPPMPEFVFPDVWPA